MSFSINQIIQNANQLMKKYGTRNPYELTDALHITVLPRQFKHQLGAYTKVLNNKFIFIKEDLEPCMKKIVLYHELGHDRLHQDYLRTAGAFHEFHLFDMKSNRMEYEANIFAAQLDLPDDEILSLIRQGFDIQQTAACMNSDINLVALKVDALRSQGYAFKQQEHSNTFLRFDRFFRNNEQIHPTE